MGDWDSPITHHQSPITKVFFEKIQSKVQSWQQIRETVAHWRSHGEKIVFTNGCFDLLHLGHIHYLADAKDLGHRLLIGLNSDTSVRRLKGERRPIQDEQTRSHLLAALACVDAVVIFEEDTPLNLIEWLLPDVLVKGGDWQPHQIVGADLVLAGGGEVRSLPFVEGFSTTSIEQKIMAGN
ncbi:MAG: D-glycero-beta-D-manno-heptose 1-phosphate adenylyltransferase [Bacteroidota bacterium]